MRALPHPQSQTLLADLPKQLHYRRALVCENLLDVDHTLIIVHHFHKVFLILLLFEHVLYVFVDEGLRRRIERVGKVLGRI